MKVKGTGSRCLLEECVKDNYYARFHPHSYHCCKEMKFIPRLDINFLDSTQIVDGRTNGRKVEHLYRTLLKAGAIKIKGMLMRLHEGHTAPHLNTGTELYGGILTVVLRIPFSSVIHFLKEGTTLYVIKCKNVKHNTGLPHFNPTFGVHRIRPCYK